MSGARLLIVTGKGGVGKSVVAAALARRAAQEGQRTLLVEVDPRETQHQILGVAPSGGERVTVTDRLELESLSPRTVVDREIASRVAVRFLAGRVLASPIYRHFVDGAPGLKELAVLERLRLALADGFDLAVLDAAASGHLLTQLEAPRLVAQAVRSGPLHEIAARLAELVADSRRTSVLLVTQPEEMPIEETFELAEGLAARLELGVRGLFVNQVLPLFPADGEGRPEALWRARRELQEEQLARLARDWRGPLWELPWFAHERGPRLVEVLVPRLPAGFLGGTGR